MYRRVIDLFTWRYYSDPAQCKNLLTVPGLEYMGCRSSSVACCIKLHFEMQAVTVVSLVGSEDETRLVFVQLGVLKTCPEKRVRF